MRLVQVGNLKGYDVVSDLLGYPYCGMAASALGSVAAKAGIRSSYVKGTCTAGGKESPHAWARLETVCGKISVVTYRQFVSPVVLLSVPTHKEADYDLRATYELQVEPGDFERLLESLADKGNDPRRFLPLKEYFAGLLSQMDFAAARDEGVMYSTTIRWFISPLVKLPGDGSATLGIGVSRIYATINGRVRADMLHYIKESVPLHGRVQLLRLEDAMLDSPASSNWKRTLPNWHHEKREEARIRHYREPAAAHFFKGNSPGWLRN